MANLSFKPDAWNDYLYWQTQDSRTLRKINRLLKDIVRDRYSGLGKPEPLTADLAGCWSRRIDDVNRIVYRVDGDTIEIVQCGSHYQDK